MFSCCMKSILYHMHESYPHPLFYSTCKVFLILSDRYTTMMSVKETTVEISQEDHAIWLDMHEMFCVTLSTLCELKIPGIKRYSNR